MSTYNGWSNWETWKTNLEILDGMTASDLGIDHYEPSEAYEASSIVKEYVEECIGHEYTSDGFVSGIIYDFLNTVNWMEITQHFLDEHHSYLAEMNQDEEVEDEEE